MEQTAGLKDLHRESGADEFEPYFKAAAILADSFLKGQSEPKKVLTTVKRYPEGARKKAARIFLEKIVLEMTLAHSTGVAAALRLFCTDGESELIEELEELDEKYRGQIREARDRAEKGRYREQLLTPFYQAGISGSALAGVNLERSPMWERKLNSLAKGHRPQLALLKEQLLATIKNRG